MSQVRCHQAEAQNVKEATRGPMLRRRHIGPGHWVDLLRPKLFSQDVRVKQVVGLDITNYSDDS